jgi:hypothetical protein
MSKSSPAGRYGDEHLDGDGKHVDNEWPAERSGVPGGILSKTHGCVVDSSNGPWLSLSPARYVAVAILARSGNAMRHRQWPVASSQWLVDGRALLVCFWQAVVSSRALERQNGWMGLYCMGRTVGATSPKGGKARAREGGRAKPVLSKADRGAGPTPSHPTKKRARTQGTGYKRPPAGNCCETGELCSPFGYPQRFQGLFLPRPNNAYLVHQLFQSR